MSRWLPAPVSTYAAEIDGLFYLIYWITGLAFILVAVAMVGFLFVYRDRKDGRRATYTHGNNTLEIIWTVVPGIVFLVLALANARSWAHIKISPPPADLTVQVRGKQFNWVFTYPGPDGQLGTKDDKSDENWLRVPVNKVVHLRLNADDVIHSFFVPQVRIKQDALPGREIIAWFEATVPGEYEIACAELCGFGHTTMAGLLKVLTESEYEAWASKKWPARAAAAALPAPADAPAASAPAPAAIPSPAATPVEP